MCSVRAGDRLRPEDLGFGRLFERIRDAVIVADAKTQRIVLWNAAAAKMFGFSASEALKLRVEELVPESLKDPNLGGGFGIMFTAVSAAVIGGTALAGGSGTVIGAALGALVLAELQNGMNLIGISANPYFIILGVAIVVSMIANVYLSRLRRAGRT